MQIAAGSQRRAEAHEPNLIASLTVNLDQIATPRPHALKTAMLVDKGLDRIERQIRHVQKWIAVTAIVFRRTHAIGRRRARLMTPIEVGHKRVPTPILAEAGLKLGLTTM